MDSERVIEVHEPVKPLVTAKQAAESWAEFEAIIEEYRKMRGEPQEISFRLDKLESARALKEEFVNEEIRETSSYEG